MRRLVMPGMAWLLVAQVPAAAQQPVSRQAVQLEEPRPAPVLPLALVPFSIPAELCRNGRLPTVSLIVSNAVTKPVATLRLRSRGRELLERLPLRCGRHVAVWDGTVGDGTRLAVPFVYYINLSVTLPGEPPRRDTFRLVVPPS
jgi:hypothetical protein